MPQTGQEGRLEWPPIPRRPRTEYSVEGMEAPAKAAKEPGPWPLKGLSATLPLQSRTPPALEANHSCA